MTREQVRAEEARKLGVLLSGHPAVVVVAGAECVRRSLYRFLVEAEGLTPEELEGVGRGLAPDLSEHLVFGGEGESARVRELAVALSASPVRWRRRYLFLGDVDRLNPAASNAILKTVEEPPSHARIIFSTRRPNGVLPTIRSRSLECGLLESTPGECEGWLREAGVEEAGDRASLCEGRYEEAVGCDVDWLRTWSEAWDEAARSGGVRARDLPGWVKVLSDEGKQEATQLAAWGVLARVAAWRARDPHWRAIGEVALQERDRVLEGRSNKVTVRLALVSAHLRSRRAGG